MAKLCIKCAHHHEYIDEWEGEDGEIKRAHDGCICRCDEAESKDIHLHKCATEKIACSYWTK